MKNKVAKGFGTRLAMVVLGPLALAASIIMLALFYKEKRIEGCWLNQYDAASGIFKETCASSITLDDWASAAAALAIIGAVLGLTFLSGVLIYCSVISLAYWLWYGTTDEVRIEAIKAELAGQPLATDPELSEKK